MSFPCLLRRRLLSSKISAWPKLTPRSSRTWTHISSRRHPEEPVEIPPWDLYCEVDAESLYMYRDGGYHPVHLGDTFKNGRYMIVHKLGYGGDATVWLARDRVLSRYVAIKISVSELRHDNQEAAILEHLSHRAVSEPGRGLIVKLLDQFEHKGRNGTHRCSVFEPLGPSVRSKAGLYRDGRLDGDISWEASRQAVQAVAYLHANGVAHGDLHPGNIVLTNIKLLREPAVDLLKSLGKPKKRDVMSHSGRSSMAKLPNYLVRPASIPFSPNKFGLFQVKLIDFDHAFLVGQQRRTSGSLLFQAPETVLKGQYDLKSDIWALGCSIFEMTVGCPSFGNPPLGKDRLIQNWVSMFGELPEDWGEGLPSLKAVKESGWGLSSLRDLLHRAYFDENKYPDFSAKDIDNLSTLLESMLQYRPEDRPQASDLLEHPWFQCDPFSDE